jgi:hypothetical protein
MELFEAREHAGAQHSHELADVLVVPTKRMVLEPLHLRMSGEVRLG